MGYLRAVILIAIAGVAVFCGCSEPEDVGVDAPVPRKRTLSVAWKVTDGSDVELACDQVDGQFVTVTFFRIRTGEAFNELFDCFRKAGTRELEEGEYMVGFDLADRFGTIATVPPKRVEVAGDTTLDEVRFRVDPSGGLVLALDTGQPANCAGGSLITGMTIELYRGTACEAATLAIDRSTSYLVDCAAPPVTGCIEKDQHVTAASLPAGEYRIRVVALQGGTPCWVHDQRHQVRAAGLSRSVVLPLTKTCN